MDISKELLKQLDDYHQILDWYDYKINDISLLTVIQNFMANLKKDNKIIDYEIEETGILECNTQKDCGHTAISWIELDKSLHLKMLNWEIEY